METIIGLVIGVIATVIVSHYYFKKSTSKKLTPFLVMSSNVFFGVDDQLRKSLKFYFNSSEIENLQQIELLIANNGEKAIAHFIEPLTLVIPEKVQILDATVLFRYPHDLDVSIEVIRQHNGNEGIKFSMPLMNRGDYFFIKCLINGKINPFEIPFHTLVEDLPRSISIESLPDGAIRKRRFTVEWAAIFSGIVFIIMSAAFFYALHLLRSERPDLFPYPWKTFHSTLKNWIFFTLWAAGAIGFGLVGLLLSFAIGLEEIFKMPPKFPQPDELGSRGWPFGFTAEEVSTKLTSAPDREN